MATNCHSHPKLRCNYHSCITLKDSYLSLLRMPMMRYIPLRSMHLLHPFHRSSLLISPIGLVLKRLRSLVSLLDPTQSKTHQFNWVYHSKTLSFLNRPGWQLGHCRVRWGTMLSLQLCLHCSHNFRNRTALFQGLSKLCLQASSIHLQKISFGNQPWHPRLWFQNKLKFSLR